MEGARLARLVQRCLVDLSRQPVENVDVYVGSDLLCWLVALRFTENAPFVGGPGLSLQASEFSLYFSLQFHDAFPTRPPQLTFLSPWINHQHIWGKRLCHSLLTDDFLDYFQDRRTHGTSMWNAACALSDDDGMGGMPRYLQVLREYLATDIDYEEEQHIKYDAESLAHDVDVQRAFRPNELDEDNLVSSGGPALGNQPQLTTNTLVGQPTQWGTDFFLKCPLIPGDGETHPCFDVVVRMGRVPSLATSMTTLCERSFNDGACSNDFGSQIRAILPHPCTSAAWKTVGSRLANAVLAQLSPVVGAFYDVKLPGLTEDTSELELILNVAGEIWRSTCIDIVKEDGYESERAMLCFVNLHFLLLCLAEERPGLKSHAAKTIKSFLELIDSEPKTNLKASVPDLGRFLIRFLLVDEVDVSLRAASSTIARELFSRNVRWVDPDYWPEPDATESEMVEQVDASFQTGQFGMKLTLFQSYYIMRSSEFGLNTLEALETCQGRPCQNALNTFQADMKKIKDISGFAEFFAWLQLDEMASGNVHEMLLEAVEDSDAKGYNGGLPWRQ